MVVQFKPSPHALSWIKFGKIRNVSFVGKDVICMGMCMNIIFINISHRDEEVIYRAVCAESGDGVNYVTGNRLFHIFAFAEASINPRIFVKTYPDFTPVSTLCGGTNVMYIALEFSDGDFLISMDGIPNFELIIWNWRNGERIASVKTHFHSESVILKCSKMNPMTIAQMEVNGSKLVLWETLICGDKCMLLNHDVKKSDQIGDLQSCFWTTDGALFILDNNGHIYSVTSQYEYELAIEWDEKGNHPTCFALYKGAILVSGPNGNIKLYRKSGTFVQEEWNSNPPQVARDLIVSAKDSLVVVTEKGNLFKHNSNDDTFQKIRPNESNFNEMCLIYPMGEQIVTLAQNSEVCLWDVATGKRLDIMLFNRKALHVEVHKQYPYVGVSFETGHVVFIKVVHKKLVQMREFFLTKQLLNKVYFAEMSKIIVVANTNIGQFFVLEGLPGPKQQVIATVTANLQIVDFILIASTTCFRLFAIVVTNDDIIAGHKFIRFCIIKGRVKVDTKEYELPRARNISYEALYATSGDNRDRVFYAMPYGRKDLHEIEIKRGERFAKINKKIHFNHYMRKLVIQMDQFHFCSYSYDGIIIVRSTDWVQQFAMISPHHRRYKGTYKAYVDPMRKYIVALGRDNTLVCLQLTSTHVDSSRRSLLLDILDSDDHVPPEPEMVYTNPYLEGKCWLEIEEIKQRERERLICDKERKLIIMAFKELRREVKKLLSKNLRGPSNEKLDVQEFNLDEDTKIKLAYDNEIDCKYTKQFLQEIIIAQDKVAQFIKQMCWDKMEEQGKSLFAIFGKYDVENFTLLPQTGEELEMQQCVEELRQIEILLSCEDSFEPWIPLPKGELQLLLSQPPKIALQIPTPLTALFLTPDEMNENNDDETLDIHEEKDLETITAFAGSMAHTFIKIEKVHYTQQQMFSFAQTFLQRVLANKENYKLKLYFNKEFENMMGLKTREINNVVERNARLRYILSEFNYFSKEKLNIEIVDPSWAQKENPELIMKVEDNEVGCTPYISPSEQAILDAIAAEQERLRLLMLADDFKERALYAMMWGVLEIRWEDELRKEVPKPKCMLEKDPENFNEEDLRQIMDYEEKVKFLNSERERYKKILTAEYMKLGNTLREGVKKFNGRLSDLLVLKLKIEMATCQENLRITRLRYANQLRVLANRKEHEIIMQTKQVEKEIDKLNKLINTLQLTYGEVKGRMEALVTKEKQYERLFKKEFMDQNPVAIEQLTKYYKRRPKTSLKNITSVTLLVELGRCLIAREKSIILTSECVDYMKSLDAIDNFTGTAILTEDVYHLMCKHRRVRIENELKMKALNMELSDADHTISVFTKLLAQRKDHYAKLLSEIEKCRTDYIKMAQNQEVQIVLKQGFVEVNTTGQISDFKEAILVSREDVFEINRIIVKVGNKKLKAMQEMMEFRREILAMEWEHKRMKMRIQDLNQHLKDIYSVRVTKEIQAYLKAKALGNAKELTFEQEIELLKKSYERMIEEMREHVHDLQKKINSIHVETKKLNEAIANINVDVCEHKLEVDEELEKREKDLLRIRMATLLKRAKLVKQIQENHNEILVLQTELELLRLKTYPTLKFKIIS